ncbi:MAG: hypothetical protein ACREBB_05140 [Nitrosotalea sp.]
MKEIDRSRVWVLGTEVHGVGKSINWIPKEIPSFADCDILIVDTTLLSEKLISSMNIYDVKKIFTEIKKRFETGLLIICISSEIIFGNTPAKDGSVIYSLNNYFWSPVGCYITKIPKGKTLKKIFPDEFIFEKYVDDIVEWDLALPRFPFNKNNFHDVDGIQMTEFNLIASNSNDVLGGEFKKGNSGSFIILPPLKTPEESINKILEIIGINKETQPPQWIDKILIPGISQIEKQILNLEKEIRQKQQEIFTLSQNLKNKNKFKQLVYETDKKLEMVVKEALELLGLKNVREGPPGKDDLLFDFQGNKSYKLCSIEVKGVEGNIKLRDLRQLGQWVDDHLETGRKSKGILISNTFRLQELNKSKKERSEIDGENLSYALKQDFCILPTHVLLDLCVWILEGNKPDIDKIENAIANAKGFLQLNDLK